MEKIIVVLLIVLLGFACAKTSASDMKRNIISNKIIFGTAVAGLLLNAALYGIYERDIFIPYCTNILAVSTIAALLYSLHIWAAGDSKLFFLIGFLCPSSLYWNPEALLTGTWWVAIYSVLLGYVYIVVESIVKCIKRRKITSFDTVKVFFINYFRRLVVCFSYTTALWVISSAFWRSFYESHYTIFTFVSILIAIVACRVEMLKKPIIIVPILMFDIAMAILQKLSLFSVRGLLQIALVIVLMLLEIISEQFDYEEIPVLDLKKGMILAGETTVLFIGSKVDGLPPLSTEDLRSRLTEEQVVQVREWSRSKTGKSSVIIIKKIPFAIFLTAGLVLYFIVRMQNI